MSLSSQTGFLAKLHRAGWPTHTLCAALLLLAAPPLGHAAQPLDNGGFETGSLASWTPVSINGGIARIVQKGTCFSDFDTRGLGIKGNFAVQLRSNSEGNDSSEATITSNAFNAGDGIAFSAITTSADLPKVTGKDPVQFEVEILDAENDTTLISGIIVPRVFPLSQGCPSKLRAGSMSSHYFSTKAFTESQRSIKIRFRQKTRLPGFSFLTLVDQVTKFNEGEAPMFQGRPVAVAGVSNTHWGTPTLDPTGSFDPDQRLYDINYTWTIDETDIRKLRRPCIGDIKSGEHRAVLYVNDGHNVVADPIRFSVTTSAQNDTIDDTKDTLSSDENTDSNGNPLLEGLPADSGPVSNDPECQIESNVEVGVVNPDYDINDPNIAPGATGGVNNPYDLHGQSSTGTSNGNDDDDDDSSDDDEGGTETDTDGNLEGTGILWKAISEGDGNLVVLLPASTRGEPAVSVLNRSGSLVENGRYVGRTNGNRPTYRFSRPGGNFSAPAILRVDDKRYVVSSPSQRTE